MKCKKPSGTRKARHRYPVCYLEVRKIREKTENGTGIAIYPSSEGYTWCVLRGGKII
jgi:hypothetical protein